MRGCWRGSAKIAKTVAGGAAMVVLADLLLSAMLAGYRPGQVHPCVPVGLVPRGEPL